MKTIPYGKHHITKRDIQAVTEVLRSDFLTQGGGVEKFENSFSDYVGSKYSVAVSNGTSALQLAICALNIKQGQKVITTPITFVATANCIRHYGGEVVFSDIQSDTYLMDLDSVEELLRSAKLGEYVGIIPVNFSGKVINLAQLRKIADQYNLWIIEDACHSLGGFFIDDKGQKQPSGNGQFADISIFSFHPIKHITSGEGGMLTTNSQHLYKKLIQLRTHGITKDMACFRNNAILAGGIEDNKYPSWYMEMQVLGFNYRMTDIQAALGESQLKKADEKLENRKKIAKRYFEAFKNQPFVISQSGYFNDHAYHLYIIEVEHRKALYDFLRTKNIYTQIHYFPCHLMPYYQELGWKENDMPNAENYYRHCISVPMFPTLTIKEQKYVIKNIVEFYDKKLYIDSLKP
ncbi:MAG: UDP-4-amino-4,6-dideoxy-N-acetyl-beta-L-altrosamine transaminase [Chitinophagales bacterium]|nr:UDP-4-amino-4,6-dideoxy-N-acetyl-beta-L-altrosamine transaminase [Chitinophagales bacterium]